MPDAFWLAEYREKAALSDPIAQSGRGHRFETVELLHQARRCTVLLDLRREHDLLDVGCGNGLLDILFSACCRRILGVEPVAELAVLARDNTRDCANVRIVGGHGSAVESPGASFDRILAAEVLQLAATDEAPVMFGEWDRLIRRPGRVVATSIPDARKRETFLQAYTQGVERAAHLTDEIKARIIERNQRASWYDPDVLRSWWEARGGEVEIRPLCESDPNADHRFDLIVTLD